MNKSIETEFRPLISSDLWFLKEMFYESLFVPPGEGAFPLEVIERPDLAKYYLGWGKAEDLGLIAEQGSVPVGAVWCRTFTEANKGYGFVAPEIPELGIAIQKPYRGQGIGTQLLINIMTSLLAQGIHQVSLSADTRNPALRLYQRHGFVEVKKDGFSCIMLKKL
ncbi:MAG: GNAT family N-acetyltransferase [Bacteroidota bacterium]